MKRRNHGEAEGGQEGRSGRGLGLGGHVRCQPGQCESLKSLQPFSTSFEVLKFLETLFLTRFNLLLFLTLKLHFKKSSHFCFCFRFRFLPSNWFVLFFLVGHTLD